MILPIGAYDRRVGALGDPRRRWVGLFGGVVLLAALGGLDAHWGNRDVISATVVIAPVFTALWASWRDTLFVAIAALAVALASATWHHNFDDNAYWLRAAVVAAGGWFAITAAGNRLSVARDSERLSLLAVLGEVGDGSRTLEQTVEAICEILVPAAADVVLIDFISEGQVRRLGVRAAGPDAAEIERWLLGRPPSPVANELGSLRAAETGGHLVERVTPEMLSSMALDPEDAERLATVGTRSSITIPLRARGRTLGALSLSVTKVSERRYSADALDFARVAAGRVALALDNAGLYAELTTAEAQLGAALDSLADAVTILTPQGRMIYANEAAARMMGYASAAEMRATPSFEIVERYEMLSEDGRPIPIDELPGRAVLRGETAEPMLMRFIERATGVERWSVLKSTAVHNREGRPVLAVNVIEDVTAVKRGEFAQRLLARAGEVLASSLDYERTLQQVADLAVPQLADWCAVSLPDRAGLLRQVAVAHVDPEKVSFAREIAARYPTSIDDETGAAQVLREGVSQCVNDIPDELLRESIDDPEQYELIRSIGMRAALIVPLMVAGRAIGTLSLVTAESGRTFSDDDVQLAEELARRAGTAVENARLYTERSYIAETLQTGLLPTPLPDMPGWATAELYRPAGEENWVGGDFYDAVPVAGGWMVVVGDVAGRGAPAAALTALARHTVRAVAQLLPEPLEAVARLNAELYERAGNGLCTLAVAVLREDGSAEVLCAGHPQPYLLHEGRASRVGHFGPMIGAIADATWQTETVTLEPGDCLVLYTDGVIDAVGSSQRFGEERLQETLTGAESAGDAVERIERALASFERGAQADDTAAVAIHRLGAAPTGDPAGADTPGEAASGYPS